MNNENKDTKIVYVCHPKNEKIETNVYVVNANLRLITSKKK